MPAAKKTTTTAAKKTTTAAKKPATTAAKKTTTAAKKTATTAAKKTTTAAKKTTTAAKKPATTAAKKPATPAGANTSMKVTATEKKVIEAYRSAGADLKKISLKVLKGEYSDTALKVLDTVGGGGVPESLGDGLGSFIGNLLGGK